MCRPGARRHNAAVSCIHRFHRGPPSAPAGLALRRPWRARAASLLAAAALCSPGSLLAGGVHQHGVARADIALDGATLVVMLELPLDDVVGFERAPRTAAERQRAAQALERLGGAQVVVPDATAGCSAGPPEITAPELGLGTGTPGAQGHADLKATWLFACSPQARPAWVELRLFDALPRLQRIEVRAVTPQGQRRALLRRPAGRVDLAR